MSLSSPTPGIGSLTRDLISVRSFAVFEPLEVKIQVENLDLLSSGLGLAKRENQKLLGHA